MRAKCTKKIETKPLPLKPLKKGERECYVTVFNRRGTQIVIGARTKKACAEMFEELAHCKCDMRLIDRTAWRRI